MTATTGSYMFHMDYLLKNLERQGYILQGEFAAYAQHNKPLEQEVQNATKNARTAKKDQSALAKMLHKEPENHRRDQASPGRDRARQTQSIAG